MQGGGQAAENVRHSQQDGEEVHRSEEPRGIQEHSNSADPRRRPRTIGGAQELRAV